MENMLICKLKVGWGEVIRQIVSFLLVCVCVCVCVCGTEGGLGGHDQTLDVALTAKSFTIICTIVKYSLPVS